MDGETKAAVPVWFWLIAALALLWEAAGCFAYLHSVTMKAADMAQYPAPQRAIFEATPAWIWAAYAVAVWVGLTGVLALLMRQRWARLAFVVSLAAAIVQFGWVLIETPALKTLGASATVVPICVIVIGAFLIWFSGTATRQGWLR